MSRVINFRVFIKILTVFGYIQGSYKFAPLCIYMFGLLSV